MSAAFKEGDRVRPTGLDWAEFIGNGITEGETYVIDGFDEDGDPTFTDDNGDTMAVYAREYDDGYRYDFSAELVEDDQ